MLDGLKRWLKVKQEQLRGQSVGSYLALVGKKWPLTALAAITFAWGILEKVLGQGHIPSIPEWVWVGVPVVCVMLAQFLVWRDLWINKVEESHGQTLRAIAKRLQGQLAADDSPTYDDSLSWVPRHIFRAHFQTLAADINSCQQAFEARHRRWSH